jgi:formylglycine-generating enzyme required for sulfatase activity
MLVILRLLVLLIWAFPAFAADEAAPRRVALVIGNGAYAHAPQLRNPPNDARAMTQTLRQLGFEVIDGIDLDQGAMRAKLAAFARELEGADAALFFYAGHGLQVGDRNYLLPIDSALQHESDLYLHAMELDDILRLLEGAVPTRVVILDACRDNPLANTLSRSMRTRSGGVGRGLAKIDAPVGTLLAYATAPNSVALDGDGEHSPFTAALLQNIATPGLEARQVLTRVRSAVIASTGGGQVPWDSSSLTGDFYFTLNLNLTVQAPSPEAAEGALEMVMWQSAERLGTESAYKVYQDRFCPKSNFCALADEALRRLAALPPEATTPLPAPAERSPPAAVPIPAPPPADLLATLPRTSIRRVQEALSALGYDPGPSDGRIGQKTRAALAAWQKAHGEDGTGALDAADQALLLAEAAPRLASAAPPREEPPLAPPPPPATAPPADNGAKPTGRIIRDCASCPELVVVPAGRFAMGSPAGEESRNSNEGPQVEVTVQRSFAIGRYEVTVGEWQACVSDGGCRAGPGSGLDRRQPVTGVSWVDARSYTTWLSRQSGKSYALPSEAEWEFAARAGRRSPFPWGEQIGRGMAACDGCGTELDATGPAPVGSFPANAFGLHDTAGNVWEWVRDCWAEKPVARSPARTGDSSCSRHTVRGGSYLSRSHRLRTAVREAAFSSSQDGSRGFRVVRELE